MSSDFISSLRWKQFGGIALVLFGMGTVITVSLSEMSVIELIRFVLDSVRQSGPVVFFSAMAVLPAIGVPVMAFLLPVGAIFGPSLGMPLVICFSLAALSVNFSLSFLASRYFFQSTVRRILNHLGYKLPEFSGTQSTQLLVIVRVTPGIPFCIQNYLLGLTSVSFGRYFAISSLIGWSFAIVYIFFGEALLHGKGKIAVLAISLGAVVIVATRLARSYYTKQSSSRSGIGDG